MDYPLVSIIIPTYNRAAALPRAVESVLAQTYQNWELLVIDDGSTDNTREALKNYGSQLRYYYQPNKGAGTARNLGIKHSRGEYIAFLDSDDLWLPHKLETQMKLYEEDAACAIVGCGAHWIWPANGKKMTLPGCADFKYDHLLVGDIWPAGTSGAVIRKQCFEHVGLFDEDLRRAQDWDMWLRIGKQYRIRCVVDPLVEISVASAPRPEKTLEIVSRCQKQVIEKNLVGRQRRKALGWVYMDQTRLWFQQRPRRLGAARLLLMSAWYFPFRLGNYDNRVVFLLRALLPTFLFTRCKQLKSLVFQRAGAVDHSG